MPNRTAAAIGVLAVSVLAGCASSTSGDPTAVQQPPTSSTVTTPSTPRPTPTRVTKPPKTSASSSPSDTTHPVPTDPIRRVTVTATDGQVYAISIWAEKESDDCAAHAYGQVADYVRTHQCTGIRQVLATTAIDGKAVGFAQNSVGFAGGMNKSYRAAGDFRTLVSSDGTGNLNDLLREGYRLPAGPDSVPQPDAFDALGQDAGVVVTDSWYLDGSTSANDPKLVKMARDIFLQV